jgi:hypothetical protein
MRSGNEFFLAGNYGGSPEGEESEGGVENLMASRIRGELALEFQRRIEFSL